MSEENTVVESTEVTMETILKELGGNVIPFTQGAVVDGKVISSSSSRIWVDVQGIALGVIPERELSMLSSDLKPGDDISASVLMAQDPKGRIVLSLRKADRERITTQLETHKESGEPMPIKITDANKGGLLVDLGDYTGFLPVSQLATQHYPKVDGGNPDEIFAKLKDLVGQTLMVKVISFDTQQNKLIFSEKAAGDVLQEEKLTQIAEGDKLEGVITGIVDFGIFVKLGEEENALEGLVHISEIAWGRVTDIESIFNVDDKIQVLVVSTSDNRVSLSIKRLLADPWKEIADKYTIGDIVSGNVTRVTPFGVFVRLDSDIDGLVHISEISNERIEDPGTILHLGEKFSFKIISIDPDAHRLGLSFKQAQPGGDSTPSDETATEKKPKAKRAKKKLSDEAPLSSEAQDATIESTEAETPAEELSDSKN